MFSFKPTARKNLTDVRVAPGDRVEKGQTIAVLDSFPVLKAELDQAKAELANAQQQLARQKKLGVPLLVISVRWKTYKSLVKAQLIL